MPKPRVPAIRSAQRATPSALPSLASIAGSVARWFRSASQDGTGGRIMTSEQLYHEMLSSGRITESGALITDDNILTVGEIFACLRILSSSIAMLPLNLMSYRDDAEEIAKAHPVQTLFSRGPNRRQTPFEFLQLAIVHKLLYGNFYALVVRTAGQIVEIWPLNPRRMQVEELDNGVIFYKYQMPKGELSTFREDEILHVRGMSKDGLLGQSTAYAASEDAGLSMRMRTFAGSLFRNGLRPSGVYTVPEFLSPEKTASLTSMLDAYLSGAENAGRTLLLQGGATWAKVSLDADEAQYIEGRQFTRSQIAMFFGVPPQFLGDLAGSTTWGSGMAAQGKGFVSYVLNPHIISLCQDLDKALLTPEERDDYYHKVDVRMLTEGDAKDRAGVHEIYLRNGVLEVDEVRTEIGYNPRKGAAAAPKEKPADA